MPGSSAWQPAAGPEVTEGEAAPVTPHAVAAPVRPVVEDMAVAVQNLSLLVEDKVVAAGTEVAEGTLSEEDMVLPVPAGDKVAAPDRQRDTDAEDTAAVPGLVAPGEDKDGGAHR